MLLEILGRSHTELEKTPNNDNTNQREAVDSGAKGLATGESVGLFADRSGIKVGSQSAGVGT